MLEAIQNALITIIQALVAAAVPTITAVAVSYIRAKAKHTDAQATTAMAQHFREELMSAIKAAVCKINQNIVDDARNAGIREGLGGALSADVKNQALVQARMATIAALSPAAREHFINAYSDLTGLLDALIEQAVRASKRDELQSPS